MERKRVVFTFCGEPNSILIAYLLLRLDSVTPLHHSPGMVPLYYYV